MLPLTTTSFGRTLSLALASTFGTLMIFAFAFHATYLAR